MAFSWRGLDSLESQCGYLGCTEALTGRLAFKTGICKVHTHIEVVENTTEFGSDKESQALSRGSEVQGAPLWRGGCGETVKMVHWHQYK